MNRFIIVDGLPYLYADGKAYAVRWDAAGFTVGAEVKLKSVPTAIFNERSIKAKCAACLDSIGAEPKAEEEKVEAEAEAKAETEEPKAEEKTKKTRKKKTAEE